MRWAATSVRTTTAHIDAMAQPNCNDQIAAKAFGCVEHVDPRDLGRLMRYDAIFVTMSKVKGDFESEWMHAARMLKDAGRTVVLFQEAETSWAMTRPWDEMRQFIGLLQNVDLFLTHNARDVELWGRVSGKGAIRWWTCLDLDLPRRFVIPPEDKKSMPILFGSSYDGRANGITGLIACRDLTDELWHQNRSVGYHDRNEELPGLLKTKVTKEIQHRHWEQWLAEISGAYMAVHPMPAAAAGRDQIAFAALGIPCIGNEELDIQRELFPYLCVNSFDVRGIRGLVIELQNNLSFYNSCRNTAMGNVVMYGLDNAKVQADRIKALRGWS